MSLFLARLNVAFQLHQTAFAFVQCEHILLRVNGRQQLIALHFEIGAAHRIARAQQLHLILIIANGKVSLALLHLLVDLIELQLLLFQARDYFRVIEFNDQVFLPGKRAQGRHFGHLHGAKQIRRR